MTVDTILYFYNNFVTYLLYYSLSEQRSSHYLGHWKKKKRFKAYSTFREKTIFAQLFDTPSGRKIKI